MVYTRTPGRFTLAGFGGSGSPVPRDLLILLGVVFATFTLQFFASTATVLGLVRLTPLVWQRGFVWQLVTYPFIGIGDANLWFLLELLILFWFGRDVYAGMGRKHFWRLIAWSSIGAALVAVAVDVLSTLAAGPQIASFFLMQGQWVLGAILIAAFATANRYATIYFMFVLPIQARWFLWIEILFAFLGFLKTHDLPGFLGICAAVGLTYSYLAFGIGRRGWREARLRLERWWLQKKLERTRRKRGLRVIQGERDSDRRGPRVH